MFTRLTVGKEHADYWQRTVRPVRVSRKGAKPQRRKLACRSLITVLSIVFLCLLAGCGPRDPASQGETGKPLAGVKLRLVVVDDPAIATAVRG